MALAVGSGSGLLLLLLLLPAERIPCGGRSEEAPQVRAL